VTPNDCGPAALTIPSVSTGRLERSFDEELARGIAVEARAAHARELVQALDVDGSAQGRS